MNIAILQKIQNDFEKIYQITLGLSITDFIINKNIFTALYNQGKVPVCPENIRGMTLLYPKDQDLDMAVYIKANIIDNLNTNNPTKRLDLCNIADFFVMAEEVSHFIYAALKAANNVPITHLELEIQAEVDKFILSILYIGMQNQGLIPASLKEFLFAMPFFQEGMSSEQKQRYLTANHLASRYCHFLEKNYLRQSLLTGMIEEVRKFYRLSQTDKISSINQKIFYH